MDLGALAATGVAALVGLTTWTQSRAANRRSDFTTITDQLRQDLAAERVQRKLTTSFVLDLLKWAHQVGPGTPAGPPPEPPVDLDLTPWRH
ncbi:hypothetical protein HY68_12690 [Streptomyces sp. AcH 505]|uniref:hypothetical protein n=1 Tax=Streptomyces sp. AcH 505 TaxID=352211 RepID=UPI0005919023|nr:hypothetical protein HY68_12690 [Streptomyces sp. AcH 505]